jgi:tripartite-type tricarboxylate transporter receptor subunit TctC
LLYYPSAWRSVAGAWLAVLSMLVAACSPAASAPSTAASKPTASASKPAAVNKEELARQFQGKTITLTVGYAPGGGFDTIARIFAEFAPQYIPGKPQMVVSNLPGGDSLVAAQKVMASKPDGLSWVLMIDGVLKRDVLGDIEDFDATRATYLGTPDNAPAETFFVVRSAVATNFEEVMGSKTPLRIADARGGSGAQVEFAKLVGLPLEPVYGYSGTSEYFAALNRSEVDGTFRGDPSLIRRLFPEWITNKTITPILFFDEPCCKEFIEQGGWKTPPVLKDVIKMSDMQKRAYEVHNALRATRVFALPPDVPENVRLGLQQAFADTLKDPGFVKAMNERVGTQVGLGSGEEILSAVRLMGQQPPEVVSILKKMYAIE